MIIRLSDEVYRNLSAQLIADQLYRNMDAQWIFLYPEGIIPDCPNLFPYRRRRSTTL